MERLTRRMCGGFGMVQGAELSTVTGMRNAVNRLAAYEDTGLAPEEINELLHNSTGPLHKKLGEWIDADRDGRLAILPCKIGDPVFYLTGAQTMARIDKPSCVEKSRCMGFYHDEKGLQIRLDYNWKGNHGTYGYFGKTVFASLDDAVAALKGGTNGNV